MVAETYILLFLFFLLTLPFMQISVQSEAVLVDFERKCWVLSGINLALSLYITFPSKAQYVFEMPSNDAFCPPPIHSGHLHTWCSSNADAQKLYIIFLCVCTWVNDSVSLGYESVRSISKSDGNTNM